jgi:SM-20-related protein
VPDERLAAPDDRIAEEIASRGWIATDGFLPPTRLRELGLDAQRLWRSGGFRHAGVGRGPSFQLRPERRSDRVRWLLPPGETRPQRRFFARMEALRQTLNRTLYAGLVAFEAHYALYPPGSRYRTHRDCFADAPHRVVSVVVYLNPDWDAEAGGALRLYLEEPDAPPFEEIAPVGGRLVCFLSDRFPHEVLPASRERLSLTGWFTARR